MGSAAVSESVSAQRRLARSPSWRFLVIGLGVPTIGSSVGFNGEAIFQIVAVESLRLDPEVVGLAFGLCIVSVPAQLAAARMPLAWARRNLRAFLAVAAGQCAVLAVLVALGAVGERIALVALGVTVLAEINVSVLYATSWHPLLSHSLGAETRQSVITRSRVAGGLLAAGVTIAFGAANDGGRAVMLLLVGAAALALAHTGRHLPEPSGQGDVERMEEPTIPQRGWLPSSLRRIYLTLCFTELAAWPLFLVYAREVLWPDVNLGLLGATQLGGALLGPAMWRPTTGDLSRRGRLAGGILVVGALALMAVRAPVTNPVEGAVTFVALAAGAAATSTVLLVLLERTHREVDTHTSVKAMTILDVVGSTAMQLGLVVAGFLISTSGTQTAGHVDPYRIYLLAGCTFVAITLLLPRRSSVRRSKPR